MKLFTFTLKIYYCYYCITSGFDVEDLSDAWISVYSLALLKYVSYCSVTDRNRNLSKYRFHPLPSNSLPASSLRALSGFGTIRRHLMVRRMCLMPRSGFQSFLRVLTQISPEGPTLGWNILVRKKPRTSRQSTVPHPTKQRI